jgi:transcription regulator Sfg11
MPTCPKCGKLISDSRYVRHLRRCGGRHKRSSRPLDSDPGAYYMKM